MAEVTPSKYPNSVLLTPPAPIFTASIPVLNFASVTTPLSIVQVAPLPVTVISPLSPSLMPPPPPLYCGIFKVAPTNVAAPLVPVVVSVKVFCLVSKAVCVAVDIGLFKSLVLSTLPRPTSLFAKSMFPLPNRV